MLAGSGMGESVRLLLVEDDPAHAAFVFALLRESAIPHFQFVRAASLGESRAIIGNGGIDLILLDLGLPDASGLDGVTQLQQSAPHIPILALTTQDNDELALTAIKTGAQDFLLKEKLDSTTLARSIRYAIERHQVRHELQTVTRQLREANENLERLALVDPLTELLNRRGLQQSLSREIENVKKQGAEVLVLLIDIDDFQRVNDNLGHVVGDMALKEMSRKIRACVRSADYVSRIGGDEFLLLMPKARASEVVRIAERIRLAISTTTIHVSTGTLQLTASIAVMMLSGETPSIDELLMHTHQILESKGGGKNRVSYGGSQFDDTARRHKSQTDMCSALSRGERLSIVRQPIIRLSDQTNAGWELLSRFTNGTLQMPDNFFRVCAEQNILTIVDHHCLKHCLSAAAALDPAARKHINLFPSTLMGIPIDHLIEQFPSDAPRETFVIEISEQQILGDAIHLEEHVQAFKRASILVAIDDVGFGKSCLENLVVLEPDIIKIDKRCTRGLSESPERRVEFARYLKVSRNLAPEVIVEGIETKDDLEVVRDLGVTLGQGFYWGMPA